MMNEKIEMIVQKETDMKSKIADGYNKKRTVELHGSHDVLTVKVIISGDPFMVDKAMKKLDVKKLDNKCIVTFSKNPQTSLDDHLDDEEDDD